MLKRNITYHISEDRIDRACDIITTIGLGEVVKERRAIDTQGRLSFKCVTDTGVMLIFNADKTKVVTLFIPDLHQVSWVYEGNTPSWLLKVVKKNRVHRERHHRLGYDK